MKPAMLLAFRPLKGGEFCLRATARRRGVDDAREAANQLK